MPSAKIYFTGKFSSNGAAFEVILFKKRRKQREKKGSKNIKYPIDNFVGNSIKKPLAIQKQLKRPYAVCPSEG